MPVVVMVADSTSRFLGLVALKLNSFMDLAIGLAPQNQTLHLPSDPSSICAVSAPGRQSCSKLWVGRVFGIISCSGEWELSPSPTTDVEQPSTPHSCVPAEDPFPWGAETHGGAHRKRWVLGSEETQRKAISSCLQTKLHWEHSLPRGHLVSCCEWGIHLVPVTWVLRTSTGLDKWILRHSQSYLFSFPWCTARPGMQ